MVSFRFTSQSTFKLSVHSTACLAVNLSAKEAGVDAFTIMRLMGHSSVTVSQRYVHPTPEGLERALDKLQIMNDVRAARSLPETAKRQLPATLSATVEEEEAVTC